MIDYLSDEEKVKVIQFNEDVVMSEAVRKVLLETIYSHGTLKENVMAQPLKNAALGLAFLSLSGKAVISNEQLAEDLRGLAHGVNLLESGFEKLSTIERETPSEEEAENPAV
jgi:hypothetical protein